MLLELWTVFTVVPVPSEHIIKIKTIYLNFSEHTRFWLENNEERKIYGKYEK